MMALGLYLELSNGNRNKRDAPARSHITPKTAHSPYSSPRAEKAAYNSTLPHLPPTQTLSSAIDRYVSWMSCNGIEVPHESCNGIDEPYEDELTPTQKKDRATPKDRKKVPNGILRPPKKSRLCSSAKKVRWRDHEGNQGAVQCLPSSCGGKSTLVDVQDGPFANVKYAKHTVLKSQNDPILSFRERDMSIQHQIDRYGLPYPIQRAPSPHPAAANMSNSSSPSLPLRRSPSPHPLKINHQGRPISVNRERSSTPGPTLVPRTCRSPSPLPIGSRQPSSERILSHRTRDRSPVPGSANTWHTRGPHLVESPPACERLKQRSSSQQWPPPQSNSSSQLGPSRLKGRSLQQMKESREPFNEPKRYAELPGREEKRYSELPGREEKRFAELPGREESRKEGHYAEIVWKSKENHSEDQQDENKRGWNLLRKQDRQRRHGPHALSPQSQELGNTAASIAKASISDLYDRYISTDE